ncbi:hypothetical protein F5Y17DRAFT_413276 [Xylariaceae sp. FL0594]|nr:hypothetical protein F5Y17DRAFT_413276 [Xylariaceae sp. FL0594]
MINVFPFSFQQQQQQYQHSSKPSQLLQHTRSSPRIPEFQSLLAQTVKMKYSIVFTALLASAAVASPVEIVDRNYPTTTTTTPIGYPTSSPSSSSTPTTFSTTTKSSTTTSKSSTSSTSGYPTTSAPGGGPTTSTGPGGPGGPTTSSTGPGGPGSGYPTTTPTSSPTSSPTSTPTGGPGGSGGGYFACPSGLFSVAQCCATDVLGVADLDCHSPSAVPSSPADFEAICAAGGDRPRCCVIPILGQSLLCTDPVGI